jgi:serine/threonine protein phosphatase PrpC
MLSPPRGRGARRAALGVGAEAVTVASYGDSRVVLCRAGGEAVELTSDHKPDRPNELERIVAASSSGTMRACSGSSPCPAPLRLDLTKRVHGEK